MCPKGDRKHPSKETKPSNRGIIVSQVYEFGPYRLDPRSGSLWRNREIVHLTAKGYATLLLLVENAGSLISKGDLLEKVWPEGFVEPANLTQTIYVLRKTLAGPSAQNTFIETIPGRGYRFCAPVRQATGDPPRAAILWPFVAAALVLVTLTIHSSVPSGANRLRPTLEAQRDYILGRHYWSQRTIKNINLGLHYFRAALKISPNYPQAYSGVADSYTALYYYMPYGSSNIPYLKLARAAAARAMELDPDSAEAHASLAFAYNLSGRSSMARAAQEFKRSIELDGNYATAREWYSWLLYMNNEPQEGLEQMARARDLDPLSPVINMALGNQLFYLHRFKDASAQWHQTIAIEPYNNASYYGAGLADEQLGRDQLAQAEFGHALKLAPTDPDIMAGLAHLYALRHQRGNAESLLRRIVTMKPVPAYSIAVVEEALGRRSLALKWLKVAKTLHDANLEGFQLDPRMDSLRHYAKYDAKGWSA